MHEIVDYSNIEVHLFVGVNIEILKDFESVEFNNTSTEPDVFRVVLDYNKLIESWINAGFPESWGK